MLLSSNRFDWREKDFNRPSIRTHGRSGCFFLLITQLIDVKVMGLITAKEADALVTSDYHHFYYFPLR